MCSDEFSAESWAVRTGTEMVDKPSKPVEKKEEAPEEEVRSDKVNARRLSSGMIEFNIPDEVIKEAKKREGRNLGY